MQVYREVTSQYIARTNRKNTTEYEHHTLRWRYLEVETANLALGL